jgi:hypothetical protein
MNNPSMDNLDRPACRPGIETSKCCQDDVRVMYDGARTFYACKNCRNECEVWHNDMRF